MKTSIIMPAYNAQAYIARSIESVLNQTAQNWELLIADDASTDRTAEIIRSFQDERIKYYFSPVNLGIGGARNLALNAAVGRYIAFLDSDDIWLAEKLEKQIRFMEEHNCSLSCTSYVKIDSNGRVYSRSIKGPALIKYKTLLRGNCIATSTAIIDTDVHGRFRFRQIRRNEDYELWLSLLRSGGQARCMGEVLMHYRVHSQAVSRNRLASACANWKIYRNYERLSVPKSLVSMFCYAISGIQKLFR